MRRLPLRASPWACQETRYKWPEAEVDAGSQVTSALTVSSLRDWDTTRTSCTCQEQYPNIGIWILLCEVTMGHRSSSQILVTYELDSGFYLYKLPVFVLNPRFVSPRITQLPI